MRDRIVLQVACWQEKEIELLRQREVTSSGTSDPRIKVRPALALRLHLGAKLFEQSDQPVLGLFVEGIVNMSS
jgi:hypothetical protein